MTFGYPRLNGKEPGLKKSWANYNVKRSPQCAKACANQRSVVVEVGPLFKRDKGMEIIELGKK